jgi:plastocyanin
MKPAIIAASCLAALGLTACGGSTAAGGTTGGTCTPGTTATFNINSTGVSPKAVCVLPAGNVRFNNNDTVAHVIEASGACAELNLGSIAAGSFATASFPIEATCGFRDAGSPANTAFQGTVAVTAGVATGGGY